MQSVLVIGMGRFGRHLAEKMQELGNDVMIVDRDEGIIEEMAPKFTNAEIGDCTNVDVLRSMGIGNFDICFVTIGEDFQSSLEITSLLKELGAKHVVSKARRDIQAKFLLRNGADEIVYPERDIAERLAMRFSQNNVFDYIELTSEYGIYEIPIRSGWTGKSILSLDVRKNHRVTILAIKRGADLDPAPDANYIFREGDHIIVLGKNEDVHRLTV